MEEGLPFSMEEGEKKEKKKIQDRKQSKLKKRKSSYSEVENEERIPKRAMVYVDPELLTPKRDHQNDKDKTIDEAGVAGFLSPFPTNTPADNDFQSSKNKKRLLPEKEEMKVADEKIIESESWMDDSIENFVFEQDEKLMKDTDYKLDSKTTKVLKRPVVNIVQNTQQTQPIQYTQLPPSKQTNVQPQPPSVKPKVPSSVVGTNHTSKSVQQTVSQKPSSNSIDSQYSSRITSTLPSYSQLQPTQTFSTQPVQHFQTQTQSHTQTYQRPILQPQVKQPPTYQAHKPIQQTTKSNESILKLQSIIPTVPPPSTSTSSTSSRFPIDSHPLLSVPTASSIREAKKPIEERKTPPPLSDIPVLHFPNKPRTFIPRDYLQSKEQDFLQSIPPPPYDDVGDTSHISSRSSCNFESAPISEPNVLKQRKLKTSSPPHQSPIVYDRKYDSEQKTQKEEYDPSTLERIFRKTMIVMAILLSLFLFGLLLYQPQQPQFFFCDSTSSVNSESDKCEPCPPHATCGIPKKGDIVCEDEYQYDRGFCIPNFVLSHDISLVTEKLQNFLKYIKGKSICNHNMEPSVNRTMVIQELCKDPDIEAMYPNRLDKILELIIEEVQIKPRHKIIIKGNDIFESREAYITWSCWINLLFSEYYYEVLCTIIAIIVIGPLGFFLYRRKKNRQMVLLIVDEFKATLSGLKGQAYPSRELESKLEDRHQKHLWMQVEKELRRDPRVSPQKLKMDGIMRTCFAWKGREKYVRKYKENGEPSTS